MNSDPSRSDDSPGWFDRKENLQKILTALYIGCGVFFLIDLLFLVFGYDKHPYLKWEKWPGFYGIYAFVACVVLAFGARYVLRLLLKRPDDLYDSDLSASEVSSTEKGESNDD